MKGRIKGTGIVKGPKPLSITISKEQRDYLERRTKKNYTSASAEIRRLIDDAMAKEGAEAGND